MKKANKFYYWFKKIGGNVVDFDVSSIVQKLNNPTLSISSFRNRSAKIKEKYNYKFNFD